MDTDVAALIAQQALGISKRALLDVQLLRGGLQSAVARVLVRAPGLLPQGVPRRLVVKELVGIQRREADIYQLLRDTLLQPPTARVLARTDTADASYLCLEDVRPTSAWPWRDYDLVVAACETLARFHDCTSGLANLPPLDFEKSLRASASQTLELAAVTRTDGARLWRRLGDLRLVVGHLEWIRERLLGSGATLIHGDVHSGNVLVRAGSKPDRVVLIDWAASRIGTPLEDLASWVHSLGCWDAESRRRHDSLLAAYLRARKHPVRLDEEVRAHYWMACASNGLAGAIRHHFSVSMDPLSSARARRASTRALDEWQRVMRRAASVLPRTSMPTAGQKQSPQAFRKISTLRSVAAPAGEPAAQPGGADLHGLNP